MYDEFDEFDELDEEHEEGIGEDAEEEETLEELQIDEDGHLKRRRHGDEDPYENYDE
jgi:hypothetical protein